MLFVFASPALFAQTYKLDYAPLRCSGEIPADFLKLSSTKVAEDKQKIARKNISRKERNLEKEFALNSNFGVDAILYSGKVLYGDVLSTYVNRVADRVLDHDKALRKKLRFYVLKSGTVNAFSTNQGMIFVTVGLLSQVENEAQLAYILCHEIIHFTESHSLEGYKRKNEIASGKGRFRNLNFDERIKAMYSHSKDNEIEADKEGLKLYLKTPYKTSAVLSSFDMLLYSYLPYDEIEWKAEEFQDSLYKFPASYTPSKANPISADEDEDDEESTHPNIRTRKEVIEKVLERSGESGDSLYLFGKPYFDYIQRQARTELIHIFLNYAQYPRAYYLAYLYKHIYKDTAFAARITAFSLYARALQEIGSKDNTIADYSRESKEHEEEGAFYYVTYFFDHISDNELAVLSVRTAWEAYQKNPNDSFYKKLFTESVNTLFKYTNYPLSRFYTQDKKIEEEKKESEKESESIPDNLSKVEKLKLKQKKEAKAAEKDVSDDSKKEKKEYTKLAFVSYFNNDYFRNTMKDVYAKNQEEESKEDEVSTEKEKSDGWYKRFGVAGDIDSIVLLNPSFNRVFIGRPDKKDLIYDERQELLLSEKYAEMARLNDIHVRPLNLMDKENLTTEKINEYIQIMEWITERIYNSSKNFQMYGSQYIGDFTEQAGTSNVCLSGVSYSIESREWDPNLMLYSILLWPTIPLYMAYQFSKIHELNLTSLVFDLKSGRISYVSTNNFRLNYTKRDYFYNQLYSMFHQLKTKSK